MFSLIITIISVALVAALALATLYYGGDAFNQGRADAKASQILSQSQQLTAAADLYKANHGVFPPSMAALTAGGYLRSVPMAQGGALDTALAVDQAWVMPLPSVPVFVLPATESGPCQRVNLRSYRMDGILAEVNESVTAQCYGPSTSTTDLKTVVAKSGTYLSALATAVSAGNPDLDPALSLTPADFGAQQAGLPDAEDPSAWTTLPGSDAASGGGSSGTGSSSGIDLWEPAANFSAANLFFFFGMEDVPQGSKVIELRNGTDSPVTVQARILTSADPWFSVGGGCTVGTVVPAGGSCQMTLSVDGALGVSTAELRLETTAGVVTSGISSNTVTMN